MEHLDAAQHLQVIRTLMERTALYRRTLAPIMLFVGAVGLAAGAGGLGLAIDGSRAFGVWWLTAAVIALGGAFAIARRQAVRDGEAVWSPPARRVIQAVLPPLAAGFLSSAATIVSGGPVRWLFVLPNAFFYGCAVHAAGFFMPRGMKLFGWVIIAVTGATALALRFVDTPQGLVVDHAFMAGVFGLLHLAYGVYLYLTEPGAGAA